MHESESNDKTSHRDEIDIRKLIIVLSEGKWLISSMTVIVSIIAVIYSLSLPNIYQSQALLAPVSHSDINSSSMGGLGGLAGLAGINLPKSSENNASKAIKKINSLSFFKDNILPNISLADLMAIKAWDSKTNEVIIDEEIYNKNTNTWVQNSPSGQSKPSVQQSFQVFQKHFLISEDKKTGFISLSIKNQSPFLAKEWADLLIEQINFFYREKDKLQAERAVNYLNQQISKTQLTEIKQAIAALLQQETQKLTLIEARKSYVYEYIDPPAVMEKKVMPRRSLICILGFLIGGILGILMVLVKHYGFKNEEYAITTERY